MYIPADTANIINTAANEILDVVKETVKMKKKGASYVGDCPKCGGKDKLTVTPSKDIAHCFVCQLTGKNSASFLMTFYDKSYTEALEMLAKQYNIPIEAEKPSTFLASAGANTQNSFRDLQLLASGIPLVSQRWQEHRNQGTVIERNRYEIGTLDQYMKVVKGDDLILNYLDLDGLPLKYKDKKGKELLYFRVRWQNPALHLNKEGKSAKYRSPSQSGSQLWIPNLIIETYKAKTQYETLFVVEGEKKSDKMCLHGMQAVGIGGIHNLSFEGMTSVFEQIIKTAGVKNIVFVIDSDWENLGKDDIVDSRPRTFAKAVSNFHKYFFAYKNSKIELKIFFAYGKDKVLKGIDDLLVLGEGIKGEEESLLEDFNCAMIDREGKGKFVNAHDITMLSAQRIYEFWHLQNAPQFMLHHKEELKVRRDFLYNNARWMYNETEDKFEMIDKIQPYETFWSKQTTTSRQGKEVDSFSFLYHKSYIFLQNRGFGLYKTGETKFRMILVNSKVVQEITEHTVRQYVKAFLEDIGEIGALDMIYRGGAQYLGPEKLANMYYLTPDFKEPQQDCQYLFFQKTYWKVTKDTIESHPLSELPFFIWKDKIIDFEPTLEQNFVKIEQKVVEEKKEWGVKVSEKCENSVMYNFFLVTSNFHWRNKEVLATDENGNDYYKGNGGSYTATEIQEIKTHFVTKMIAAGYILHEYRDLSQMKAIICMDGVESEVGKSKGGSGKSIYATMFKRLLPTVLIDGKKKNLTDDAHIYDAVDERTNIIVFDDCRVNLDFEHFFSQITSGVEVNQKGQRRFTIAPPKMIFSTNHAVRGNDDSTTRRQYNLAFSDYFNRKRTPKDLFGSLMFTEWEHEEWNNFYNFMASCIQTYLNFNNLDKYTIMTDAVEKRKLRQEIGENFLEFADVYFAQSVEQILGERGDDTKRNCLVAKDRVFTDYLQEVPTERKFMTVRILKDKVKSYCKYRGLLFNPGDHKDGRVKFGTKEYIIVADNDFNMTDAPRID